MLGFEVPQSTVSKYMARPSKLPSHIRVQKGPKQDGDSYYMVTRMPVAWWWLPVQEHPGDMEVTRAWQVMSAIHTYIATNKDANGNLPNKDDKTGETCRCNSWRSISRCAT